MDNMILNGAVLPSLSAMSFGPQSFASEANSFVVLERETAEGTQPGQAAQPPQPLSGASLNGNLVDAPVSNHFGAPSYLPNGVREPQSFSSQLSDGSPSLPGNVQQRMDSLIQENIHLQVTVDQTNLSLRQMMATLSQWRVDVEKVRQEHKEKFQETRALVMNLKKEKSEMRAFIEELQSKLEEYQTREAASSFMTVEPTVSEMELKSTVADLQSKLNIVDAAYQAEQEKAKNYEEEIDLMKKEMSLMKDQIQHYEHLQKDMEKKSANSEEIQNLREENKRLILSIENLNSVERHSQDYQAAQTKGFTNKLDELTAKLIRTDEELQRARAEIDRFKSNEGTSKEEALTNALATVDRLRSRIDEMTANIVELDQKCERQTQDITALQDEKNRLNEAVGILQAQVEVYQSDFIAERDCREALAGEKEQLAEDLRRLHRHNQELRQNLADRGENTSSAAAGPANRNGAQAGASAPPVTQQPAEEAQPANSMYRCVICNVLTFRTLQALNEHIDHCLENAPES
ncbi:NF-kappa-B essential modulator [Thrips palmi]|uniref:NF-kappa-B essential modulator n=1 Tax=Thrips palmi TaxID=161013 RepID=A0A6P8YJA5_THRPL|nr:NF-kappa-B essential modulator [Thrips palmi]